MILVDVPKDSISSQRIELDQDGVEYTLVMNWSNKYQRFYMDIYDSQGSDILLGIKLVSGIAINLGNRNDAGPYGLFLILGSGTMKRDSFTTGAYKLYYFPRQSVRQFPLSLEYALATDFITFLEEEESLEVVYQYDEESQVETLLLYNEVNQTPLTATEYTERSMSTRLNIEYNEVSMGDRDVVQYDNTSTARTLYLPIDVGPYAVGYLGDTSSGTFENYSRVGTVQNTVSSGEKILYGSNAGSENDIEFGVRFWYDGDGAGFTDIYISTNCYLTVNGTDYFITGVYDDTDVLVTSTTTFGNETVYNWEVTNRVNADTSTVEIPVQEEITSVSMNFEIVTSNNAMTGTMAFAIISDGNYSYISPFYGNGTWVQTETGPDRWKTTYTQDITTEFLSNLPVSLET